ncbi:hypothetical protein PAMA_020610 [Pampus argenteus]
MLVPAIFIVLLASTNLRIILGIRLLPEGGLSSDTSINLQGNVHPSLLFPLLFLLSISSCPLSAVPQEFSLLRLDDVVDQRVNIVGFSVFNKTHPFFQDFVLSLNRSWQENCDHAPFAGTPLSSALLFDAVYAVVAAVQELNRSQNVGATQLSCKSSKIWEHGTSLMNYLRMVELEGLTGHIEFNSKGQRSNYALRIMQNSRDGLRQENPYVMLRPNHQELEGNDRYEGFCVDMLKELADILKFKYRIRLVADGLYGVPGANGTWTGMVGELISRPVTLLSHGRDTVDVDMCVWQQLQPWSGRKADLAVAGLTITAEREKVIDFSKPYMTLGISIMYRVHLKSTTCYLLRSTGAAVPNHELLTPYEWYNPHPCLKGRCNLLINQYSLGNSFWFPVGGFMQQGSTIAPRALSTRCVSGVWWAFTLIIISSYTANLAAFLTVQRMEVPIESVDDLADQTAIEYGTMHGGSTMTFFQNSRYQTYQRMWNFMHSKQPSVFVKSTEEGIARVLNSNYAYLLESTMNEYYRQRNCNLTQIGGLLDTKGYGIGMPLGSVYRDEFDLAILKLQEDNRLEILKRKWWDGGKCPKEEDHRAKGLGMENIGGIFVVLVCGLLVAIFMAVLEFVWMLRQTPGTEVREGYLTCICFVSLSPPWHPPPRGAARLSSSPQQSVCEEMLRELQGIVLCRDSLQVRRRRTASILRPRPLPLEERRARAAAASLSNGKLCGGTGLPEPLSHRLAQEAALVARGCSHIRICPECRRFQGLRMRPAGVTLPSPTHSEESIEWDKTTNSSEPE